MTAGEGSARELVQFSVKIPRDSVDLLDQIAAERVSSRSAVVREAVEDWLRKPAPEQTNGKRVA